MGNFRFKQGYVETMEKDKQIPVIVDSGDAPISGKSLAIGFGMVVGGIFYLMTKSFRSGATAHEIGEYKALDKLGVLSESSKNE